MPALQSTRLVRALLLKGAKRDASDAKGRSSTELIPKELQNPLKNDLKSMLVRFDDVS